MGSTVLEVITSDAANERSSKKKEGQIQQLLLKITLTEKSYLVNATSGINQITVILGNRLLMEN